MDTLILIVACLYVLFKSYVALERMPKVSVLRIFHELTNPRALKYWACGMYSLFLLAHADNIQGLYAVVLILPPLYVIHNKT